MPSIRSIALAVPAHQYGNTEIFAAGRVWLQDHPEQMGLFERFVSSAQTENRYFTRPVEEILEFRGMKDRAAIFESSGTALGLATIENACVQGQVEPSSLGVFLFTSCSSPVIPSIDANLIHSMNLDPTITRIPMYQHGCAGGVVGLALAERFARDGTPVLLTSVELCSLGFQALDHTAGHLVGSAIFGDGAASVVISPDDEGLVFVDSQSILTRDSRHMMGYDIHDDGSHLRLDKELPSFLAKEIPLLVPPFLERNGLRSDDIDWWLFHPGGVKILNCLEAAFDIPPERARWAREVLRDFGNLSSASILFVTAQFLKSDLCDDGDRVLMIGVGPGLTVQLILFEVRRCGMPLHRAVSEISIGR